MDPPAEDVPETDLNDAADFVANGSLGHILRKCFVELYKAKRLPVVEQRLDATPAEVTTPTAEDTPSDAEVDPDADPDADAADAAAAAEDEAPGDAAVRDGEVEAGQEEASDGGACGRCIFMLQRVLCICVYVCVYAQESAARDSRVFGALGAWGTYDAEVTLCDAYGSRDTRG